MAEEDEGFQILSNNFPPNPVVIEVVNGKVTCDLTSYDPPPDVPSKLCSNPKLQVLKMFNDYFKIPKELGNLRELEQLILCRCESDDVNRTKITKIPTTLRNLHKLKILDLRNNVLQTFPPQLVDLLNLEELHVNNCQLSSLPNEFARLQQLNTLDLSNNQFTTLPICVTQLHKLSKLYISDGRLQSLCGEIKNLVNLERLQLTSNELTSLPEELFELVKLKKLYLNNNRLTSLHNKVGNLVNLEFLVLNQNKLSKIPESIGKLKELRYLNVHENMLSCLPETITELTQINTFLVDNNPLQVPPVHVCSQGIPSIRNYFQARDNTGNFHSKRLKVVVVGESMAGKTSLVDALMKGRSTEIHVDDRTFGVVFYHWKPEPHVDELELVVVDCAGQKNYLMTHQLFLSEGALFILAVNLSRYVFDDPDDYQVKVGQWISMIAARIPRARILVVPTHIDECRNEEEIDLKCGSILTNMKEQRAEMARNIDAKSTHIKKTEGRCLPPKELAKVLEEHREQKDNLPVISLRYKEINDNFNSDLAMTVTPVSNTKLDGMANLRQELVRIARNKSLSPNIDINLPESWVNIEKEIARYRKTDKIPCFSIAELQQVLKEQEIDVLGCELRSCVSYLDAIGEIQYFKNIDGLVKNVVINPYWIGSVLKQIFRHDMEKSLTYNDSIRKMNIFSYQFEQDKEELVRNGVMTQTLIKCVWAEFIDESDEIFPQLLKMLTHFGLTCEMPAVGISIDMADGTPPPSCYMIPWLLKSGRPTSMRNHWPLRADSEQVEVTVGYALLQYVPCGLFERFSVLCHRHEPNDFHHWQNGFYMKFGDVLIQSKVMSEKKCGDLKVSGRAPRNLLDNLWKILLTLLEEIKKILNEWPGLIFAPFTVCPKCIENNSPSPHQFTCNWFSDHKAKRKAICKNRSDDASHEVQLDLIFPSEDVLKNYRKPVMHSNEIPDCILGDDMLDDIADMLGTEWPRLARRLDLLVKVSSIRGDHRGDTHEQAVMMMTKWKQKRGKNAKIKIFIEALRDIDFNDIADFILSQCRAAENSTDH